MNKTLEVKQSTAVELFVALEFKTAPKWDEARLLRKLNNFEDVLEGDEPENFDLTPKQVKLAKALLKADKVTLRGAGDKAEPEEKPDPQPKGGKKSKKKETKKPTEKESKKKPTKKESAPKASKKKKPDQKKASSPKKVRIQSSVEVLKKVGKRGTKMEALVKAADDNYAKAGGSPNIIEARYSIRYTMKVMASLGILQIDGDLIRPIG